MRDQSTKAVTGRKGKGKKSAGKRAKRSTNLPDYASVSVASTFAAPGGAPPQANVMYSLLTTSLSQYDRAVQVAKAYQFYKIKNVTIRIKPQFDTYAFGSNGYSKPKLYSMLDKSGSIPTTVTLDMLKSMGARPRNLDEKALTISFAPAVLTLDYTGGVSSQAAQKKVSPWLTTSANTINPGLWVPNSVDHLGVYWWVDSTSYGGTGGLPYQVDVEVQFQFKKPLWPVAVNTVAAVEMIPAIKDASPDGIEGGSDGITIPIVHQSNSY